MTTGATLDELARTLKDAGAASVVKLGRLPTPETALPMFDIVLVQPEIPPNTGNVDPLAANTGARLHLVRALGFSLETSS
jgi:hypothetical protein